MKTPKDIKQQFVGMNTSTAIPELNEALENLANEIEEAGFDDIDFSETPSERAMLAADLIKLLNSCVETRHIVNIVAKERK